MGGTTPCSCIFAATSGDGEANYYEHVLEKVPFGSKRWWSIYEEQHGTPD